ncbi:MAG: hypothetical protein EZS28_013718 [Streblomastix strix]|uniref:Uncharacterized protein n=1 Tax=Streblomastix strix TaxID=222440 RepID=A0A5J4W7S4_9EUKA|nr:MAG: hypothetical protein EZS28_013718 [Streblomastix strix]
MGKYKQPQLLIQTPHIPQASSAPPGFVTVPIQSPEAQLPFIDSSERMRPQSTTPETSTGRRQRQQIQQQVLYPVITVEQKQQIADNLKQLQSNDKEQPKQEKITLTQPNIFIPTMNEGVKILTEKRMKQDIDTINQMWNMDDSESRIESDEK